MITFIDLVHFKMSNLNVAVLGAGVVGLTSAIELKKEFPNINITIIADKFNEDTTSDGAAGLFRPGTSFCGPTDDITRKWIYDAFHYWEDIGQAFGPEAGVTELSGYIFSSTDESIVRNHFIEKIVPIYRAATEEELNLCPGNWKYGSFFSTMLTECRIYLPWAMNKFKRLGGQIIQQKINSFLELNYEYDLIINCTGLGAKYLCDDYKIVPMRGQVLKVQAPFIKTFFYADYDTYIIPGFNAVTLGGCRQFDSYDLKINRHDAAAIKERCYSLVPSLQTAPIIKHWVGLRPHRNPVRVEKQILNINNKQIKIVHNYGHGGYGVTTAPGTALYAVKQVKELFAGNSKL